MAIGQTVISRGKLACKPIHDSVCAFASTRVPLQKRFKGTLAIKVHQLQIIGLQRFLLLGQCTIWARCFLWIRSLKVVPVLEV